MHRRNSLMVEKVIFHVFQILSVDSVSRPDCETISIKDLLECNFKNPRIFRYSFSFPPRFTSYNMKFTILPIF